MRPLKDFLVVARVLVFLLPQSFGRIECPKMRKAMIEGSVATALIILTSRLAQAQYTRDLSPHLFN
jgi:hypothetical protein